jgi:probable HAF family extracellular repeat protein
MFKKILFLIALCLSAALTNAETLQQILSQSGDSTPAAVLQALNITPAQAKFAVTAVAVGTGSGINNYGDLVGTLSSNAHAFLFKNGKLMDLGIFKIPGGPPGVNKTYSSSGVAVNDSDAVSGSISDFFPQESVVPEDSFLYVNGTMTNIAMGSTDGGFGSSVGGINNLGVVVGSYDAGGTVTNPPAQDAATPRAFLYRNGQQFDIGTLGGRYSLGYGINNAGQVVGVSTTTTSINSWQAYLYSNGRMQIIGGANSGNFYPSAINDNDWVTGTVTSSPIVNNAADGDGYLLPPQGKAVLYVNGKLQYLGSVAGSTGSQGVSINNSGIIVGNLIGNIVTSDGVEPGVTGAFAYACGQMFNLNDFVQGGWKILSVGHINDAGQIAATGSRPGSNVAYALLLNPPWMSGIMK